MDEQKKLKRCQRFYMEMPAKIVQSRDYTHQLNFWPGSGAKKVLGSIFSWRRALSRSKGGCSIGSSERRKVFQCMAKLNLEPTSLWILTASRGSM